METFNVLSSNLLVFVVKMSFLTSLLLVTIFLLVVLKQVSSMSSVVHDSNDSFILKAVSFSLLMFSLSLFLISIAIL